MLDITDRKPLIHKFYHERGTQVLHLVSGTRVVVLLRHACLLAAAQL